MSSSILYPASSIEDSPASRVHRLFYHPGYDYSASAMDDGGLRKYWWCGNRDLTPYRDFIYYRERNLAAKSWSKVHRVLAPAASGWDRTYTCDPSVIKGNFGNPEDRRTYTYAMYYTATADPRGGGNAIGLAFSNDGRRWVRYQNGRRPLISAMGPYRKGAFCYGAGQASAIGLGGSAVALVYMDDSTSRICANDMWVTVSPDGINFERPVLVPHFPVPLPSRGEFVDGPADADFALDSSSGEVYTTLPTPGRHDGRFQFGIYRMPIGDLLSGTGSWDLLGIVDSSLTGHRLIDSPGIVRDGSGRLPHGPDSITTVFGAGPSRMVRDLVQYEWRSSPEVVRLRRYVKNRPLDHWATSGYVTRGYRPEKGRLGDLFTAPKPGTHPIFSCTKSRDHYLSLKGCDAEAILGIVGWAYDSAHPEVATVPLYRCYVKKAKDHFVSTSRRCEGHQRQALLGYAVR